MYVTTTTGSAAHRRRALLVLCAIALTLTACSSRAASRARIPATPVVEAGSQRGTSAGALPSGRIAAAACTEASRGDGFDQTVRLLASPDFETRSHAARRLVAAGDAALPALGRAGDLPVRVDGGLQVSATRPVVRSLLGESGDPDLLDHLASPWPTVRREAAVELGRRDRWSAVPRLIDHLDDGDAEVRAASAEALRRVTNHFFGYRAEATVAHRRRTADRWRTWWSVQGRSQAQARSEARTRSEGPGGS